MRTHVTATRLALVLGLIAGQAAFAGTRRDRGGVGDPPPPPPPEQQAEDDSGQHGQQPFFFDAFAGVCADEVDHSAVGLREDMIVVYQHRFGVYPYVDVETGERVNGGVPQRANLSAHLEELQRDIDRQIPEGYTGYVCIDYEDWVPVWEHSPGRIREYSRELIRRERPNWDDARVERKAKRDFESAAKLFFTKTFDMCHDLRPDAMWGLWSYPKAGFRDDDLDWLWSRTDAFFPSIYMRYRLVPDDQEPGEGEERVSDFVQRRLVDRVAYARELAGDRPVISFLWSRYSKRNPDQWIRLSPLTQHDLAIAFEGSLDYGADGVALWENIPQPHIVEMFQQQFDETIAPEMCRILAERGFDVDEDVLAGAGDGWEDPTDEEGAGEDDDRVSQTPPVSNRHKSIRGVGGRRGGGN